MHHKFNTALRLLELGVGVTPNVINLLVTRKDSKSPLVEATAQVEKLNNTDIRALAAKLDKVRPEVLKSLSGRDLEAAGSETSRRLKASAGGARTAAAKARAEKIEARAGELCANVLEAVTIVLNVPDEEARGDSYRHKRLVTVDWYNTVSAIVETSRQLAPEMVPVGTITGRASRLTHALDM